MVETINKDSSNHPVNAKVDILFSSISVNDDTNEKMKNNSPSILINRTRTWPSIFFLIR